jgi:beta-mannosidase
MEMNGSKIIAVDGWRLSFTYQNRRYDIPATVPGNVELDLQREGLIHDPCPPDDAQAMHAFELLDWVYETTLNSPQAGDGEKIDLLFEGIDTVADIYLNDEAILHCENMFIPHLIDVTHKLKPTGNKLRVQIFSPELFARRYAPTAIHASREHRHGEAYLRKARHMWGWDNAPRLLSAGLWRPVTLVVRPPIRFTEVYAYTNKVFKNSASVGIDWNIVTPDLDLASYKGKVIFSFNGQVEHEQDFEIEFTSGSLRRDLTLQNPHLWWPSGYGQPHLYDLQLLLFKDHQLVAEWQSKFGIREIELIRTETTDEHGKGEFVFKCNGEKIYIRGANWKPVDPLHSQATAKIRRALDLCVDLHCNMVRVWGGGVYEDHDFFDYCDERGLLVWQDFMFACEFPPQDDFYQRAAADEADVIVKRLRNHPSLALWCGDNETDQAFFWGMLIPPKLLPSENDISRKVLKRAVRLHDPYRDYLESSPYISDDVARLRWTEPDCKLRMAPEQHLYLGKQIFLTKCCAHFVSETGANLMSESPEIVEREIARAKRLWDEDDDAAKNKFSDGCESHQLDGYFVEWKKKTRKSLRYFFNRDFAVEPWQDLALAVNILGGDYCKSAVEHFRIGKWRRTGIILWSLLDMWPMMFNASLVDSLFRKKMPYYWVRQSQQPFCLMVQDAEPGDMSVFATGQMKIFAANDTLEQYCGQYRILRLGAEGQTEELLTGDFLVNSNTTSLIATMPSPEMQALLIIEWTIKGRRYFNHFISGSPPFDFETFRNWCSELDKIYNIDLP